MIDLRSLNPEQRQAVEHFEGPALVLAGAGSGKTRVITTRIAHLIDQGVSPNQILGVTFTNKAAKEMRERVASLVDPRIARRVHLSTFHALGAQILREDIERIGYTKPFAIMDESDRFRVLKQILKELRLGGTRSNEARLLHIISKAKNASTTPARLPEARFNPEMPRAQRVFDKYQQALLNLNAVDFDDLLLLPTRLLREHGDLRAKYRERYRFVMVDEYQDTNPIQLAMLQELVGPPYNLMVVGDDDQSIYAFRGAVSEYILRFGDFFDNPKIVALEQNYRSVGNVLKAANAVIANNAKRHTKTLWSSLGDGKPIELIRLDTEIAEAQYLARRIAGQAAAQRRPWEHFAILYRANPQARELEEALRSYKVPYRIVGGQSLFDKKEARDVVAYMQLLINPRNEMALRRIANVPSRGVGTVTMQRFIETAQQTEKTLFDTMRHMHRDGAISGRAQEGVGDFLRIVDTFGKRLRDIGPARLTELLADYVDAIGLESAIRTQEKNPKVARVRWNTIKDLIQQADRYEGESAYGKLDAYVGNLVLDPRGTEQDEKEARNKVTLMTFHGSKGLEFPVVFMCGMNDGKLPHKRALDEKGGVSEERRLCYVGMTRAKEQLVMTWARSTVKRHERISLEPSRFLNEIPPELVSRFGGGGQARPTEADEVVEDCFAKMRALLEGK